MSVGRHRPRGWWVRPVAIGLASVIAPLALYAMHVGDALSVTADPAPSTAARPSATAQASGRAERTPAPIFTEPAPDEPQPWSPDDGPIYGTAPAPTSAPSSRATAGVADRPAPTTGAPRRTADRPEPLPVPQGEATGGPTTPAAEPPAVDQAATVLELVNRARAAAGCLPVADDPELTAYSQRWAQAQADDGAMSHSDGPYAENVAAGYDTADDVMDGWMSSPGHRGNIETCAWTRHGVGAASDDDGRLYWTQVFAT